jgi:hypothetical protein
MPDLDSEAVHFRAASELLAPMPDSTPPTRFAAGLVLFALLAAACGDAVPVREAGSAEGWTLERHEQRGTEYVRISGDGDASVVLHEELRIGSLEGAEHEAFGGVNGIAPAPDGSFAVLDAVAMRVHRYGPDGGHLGSFGSRGEGPGEFSQPQGISRLPDGRLAVTERHRPSRLSLFTAEGEFLETRPLPLNVTGAPLAQSDGALFVRFISGGGPDRSDAAFHVVRAEPGPADTVLPPELAVNPAWAISVRDDERGTGFRAAVPFTPGASWARHPDGYWIAGTGERYEVFQISDAGDTLRVIEREARTIPVAPDEAADVQERITVQVRRVDPDWRWNVPGIPQEKPFFRMIVVGTDGSFGVWRHAEAEPAELPPELADLPPGSGPPRFVEPPVLDLFEADGRFAGTLRLPAGTGVMAFSLDRIFLRETDELGVARIVRARLELPGLWVSGVPSP